MGYESVVHEAEGRIGYWLRGHVYTMRLRGLRWGIKELELLCSVWHVLFNSFVLGLPSYNIWRREWDPLVNFPLFPKTDDILSLRFVRWCFHARVRWSHRESRHGFTVAWFCWRIRSVLWDVYGLPWKTWLVLRSKRHWKKFWGCNRGCYS